MTTTDERQRRDLIEFATRGQLRTSGKAAIVSVLVILVLLLTLKSVEPGKHKSSAVAPRGVHVNSVDVSRASNCSDGYALTSIWLAIGCANSPALAQRQ
jgi:hypothetical protein